MSHSSSSLENLPPTVSDRASRNAVIVIGILAVVLGILVGRFNPFLGSAKSVEGLRIDALFSVLLGIGTTVFVIVQGGLLYSAWRFRARSDDDPDGLPIRGHVGLEVVWSVIPAGIVTGLAIFSYIILADIERPQATLMTIEVTGRQFNWEFYYPDRDVRTNELHLPRGRQVLLKLRAADVLHSFWVPEFRIKKDLLPDRVTETYFTPTENGTYPIVCAELCGVGHAVMQAQAVVQDQADFDSWLGEQARAKAQVAADPATAGRQLFNRYGCNACHVLPDANAVGQVGPSLAGIGTKAGSAVPGQPAEQFMRESIVNPNAHLAAGYPPNLMPQDYEQRMSDQELEAMVQYLLMQK